MKLFQRHDIGCNGNVYLTRWVLIRTRFGAIYLHKFHRSDWVGDGTRDAVYYDHPWSYVSIILRGGYWEHVRCDTSWCPAAEHKLWCGTGSLLIREPNWKHWVELPEGKTAWSLVFRGPVVREWGFWPGGNWRKWTDYLKETGCE